jgi:carboxylesterase
MAVSFALRTAPDESAGGPYPGIYMPGRNGQAVMLIHGLTGAPNEMRFVGWYCHSQGYTVSCPRLANHGRPLHALRATPWEAFFEGIREAHRELCRDHDRVFVGGLSMGALLALLLAAEDPAGVAGVSCLSPTLFYDGWNVPWYHFLLPLASRTGLGNNFYFKEEPPYGLKNERIRERVHQYYAKATVGDLRDADRYGYPFFPVRLLAELRRLVRHLEPRLPRVECPCQVIQARHDDVSSVRNAQFVHDRVASRRKEIVYLENSYHVITADQERGKVATRMVEFFSGGPAHA